MNDKICVSQNIRNYRKNNRLSQKEFGRRIGVTAQAVSKWERGTAYPDIFILPSIAGLLGVSIDELLTVDLQTIRS